MIINKMKFKKRQGLSLVLDRDYIRGILIELDIIVPIQWAKTRYDIDGPEYYMNIVEDIVYDEVPKDHDIRILGYVEKQGIAFLVCDYPAGTQFRIDNGLCDKNFYIILGQSKQEIPNIDKSFLQIKYREHVYHKGLENFQKKAIVHRLQNLPIRRRWCSLF